MSSEERGLTLIELLISLAVMSIFLGGAFSLSSLASRYETSAIHLSSHVAASDMMKSALDNTLANAQEMTGSEAMTVSTSNISFYYAVNPSTSPTVCHGTLTIQQKGMLYTVSGGAACTDDGSTSASTFFPVGSGWTFQPLVTHSECLGPAFENHPSAQLTADQSSQNGYPASEVLVCLPNF